MRFRAKTAWWREGLAGLTAMALAATPVAAADASREDQLRVAMLSNIARFVWWMDDQGGAPRPLEFCVSDAARISDSFADLAGKKVRSRPVSVRVIPQDTLSVRGCSVVYFARDGHLTLERAAPDPFTLTTGDISGFTDMGGVIEFVRVGRQQRFSINVRASRSAKLEISSRLIDLAIRVE